MLWACSSSQGSRNFVRVQGIKFFLKYQDIVQNLVDSGIKGVLALSFFGGCVDLI